MDGAGSGDGAGAGAGSAGGAGSGAAPSGGASATVSASGGAGSGAAPVRRRQCHRLCVFAHLVGEQSDGGGHEEAHRDRRRRAGDQPDVAGAPLPHAVEIGDPASLVVGQSGLNRGVGGSGRRFDRLSHRLGDPAEFVDSRRQCGVVVHGCVVAAGEHVVEVRRCQFVWRKVVFVHDPSRF